MGKFVYCWVASSPWSLCVASCEFVGGQIQWECHSTVAQVPRYAMSMMHHGLSRAVLIIDCLEKRYHGYEPLQPMCSQRSAIERCGLLPP
jgi:hypothetical protein